MLSRETFEREAARWPCHRKHFGSWVWDWTWNEAGVEADARTAGGLSKPEVFQHIVRQQGQSGYLRLATPLLRSVPRHVSQNLVQPSSSVDTFADESYEDLTLISEDNFTFRPLDNQKEGSTLLTQEWTLHIVFHETWRVPALYLSARFQADGSPVTDWADLVQCLPESLHTTVEATELRMTSEWPVVTHELHPATGEPCFHFHPCSTASRMASLFSRSDDFANAMGELTEPSYLLAWFSMISPSIGIAVPAQFFMDQCSLIQL